MKSPAWLLVPLVAVLLVSCSRGSQNQALDMVAVCGQKCTVLLDNDRVRIVQVVLKPEEDTGMHAHPVGDIWMNLDPARVRVTPASGEPQDRDRKAMETVSSGPETHSIKNIGSTDYRSVVIELKK
jgi:hypothetical protein